MNIAKERFRPFGIRQSLRGLALLLLSGIGPEPIPDDLRHRAGVLFDGKLYAKEPMPYLPAIGPPGLRFRELEPAATPTIRPIAVGPPVPGLSTMESAVAAANSAASLGPLAPSLDSVTATENAKAALSAPSNELMPVAPSKSPAPPILRDDVKPLIHPEDFLPYFQIPNTPVPPSSASYTQTPK